MLPGLNNEYFRISVRETVIVILKSVGVTLILDYFFFKSGVALIFLIPVGIAYFQKEISDRNEKIRHEGREQFKELLLLSSTNMRAGYSVENALLGCYEDIANLYGRDCLMCKLLLKLSHQRTNKKSLETVFINAGCAMNLEEMVTFGRLYEIAYQKSGNLSLIMDKAATTIIENIETENEIYISLCERRFEMKIMNLMPLAIMFYINLTNNGYFDKMYHNLPGIVVMSVCLGAYILAYYAGYKIMKIRV